MNQKEQSLAVTSALMAGSVAQDAALRSAIHLWAKAKTSESAFRHQDLVRKKREVVQSFFSFVGKSPGEVDELDVERWLERLGERKLKPATVYARVSFVSSFYRWAMRDPGVGTQIRTNPVTLARPKAPRARAFAKSAWGTQDKPQSLFNVSRIEASRLSDILPSGMTNDAQRQIIEDRQRFCRRM